MSRIIIVIISLLALSACEPAGGSSTPSATSAHDATIENITNEEEFYSESNISMENCHGTSDVEQTVTRTETTTVEVQIGTDLEASLEGFVKARLETRFNVRINETKEVSQSFTVRVQAASSVEYKIRWYETWRVGELVIEELSMRIPFRVRTGLEGRLGTGQPQSCSDATAGAQTSPSSQTAPTTQGVATTAVPTTPAPTGCTLTVLIDELNFRSGPSVEYEIYRYLPIDSTAPIIGRNGNWWYINYNGSVGWVSALPDYTRAEGNCSSVPSVNAPPLPPTVRPTTQVPVIVTTTAAPLSSERSLLTCSGGISSPDLFYAWEVSEDGTNWIFYLEQEIFLADGQYLTTSVVFDYFGDRLYSLQSVVEVIIVDDFTLMIVLLEMPSASFLCSLASFSFEVQ
jgi:uncharacterized protein YraI